MMNAQRFAVLILAAIVGCGTSERDAPPKAQSLEHPQSTSTPAKPRATDGRQTATDGDDVVAVLSPTEQKVSSTGVKQSVLLTCMNTNVLEDKRYHHQFELLSRIDDTIMYKDTNSPLYLTIMGPPNDLILIELVISLDDFIEEQPDGQFTGDGAAAFGRCVQRLTMAVDPNWVEELYDWMNKHIGTALFTEEGATVTRKGLMVKFDTTKFSDDQTRIHFAIGTPEKE